MTQYEYDDSGLLVRSVTSRESRWTEQDRAEVLALADYRDGLCPCGCGHQMAETLSHEEKGPQFIADRVVCRARLQLIEAQIAAEDPDKPNPYAAARLWRVDKR